MRSACFIGWVRISIRNNNSYNHSQLLDLHGVLQGNTHGDNHVGDLCCYYSIDQAGAQKHHK